MVSGPCTVEPCEKPRRTRTSPYCGMHYERLRRTGTLEPRTPSNIKTDQGYIKVKRRGHPLADRQGYVAEHRLVAYGLHGPGPQNCIWCDIDLVWGPDLHIDHLDHDRGNNAPDNLVISCRPCNTARKKDGDPERWAQILAERLILRRNRAAVIQLKYELLEKLAV